MNINRNFAVENTKQQVNTVVKNKKKKATALLRAKAKKQGGSERLTYDKLLKLFEQTDKKFQETREQMKDTDKKIKELAGLFTTQWGKLVEALLGKGCLSLFIQRGIKVTQTSANAISKRDGKIMEIDVLLVNGTEAVVIEVKTT